MKKKINIPSLAVTMLALISAFFLTYNPTLDDPATTVYEGYIDKYITTCSLKERLFKDSRFENIRKSAALAMKKATFFSANKERLIAEMIEEKIGKKHYDIVAYLNARFHESTQKESRVAYRTATTHQ